MSINQVAQISPSQSWSLQQNQPHFFHIDHYNHHYNHEVINYRKEYMFEKSLTPSDVGKLNRLVIPKQHAEKYFPLDSDSGETAILLSFEDESGKLWKFRYSYWTSSQSYVLTKGWSRFVKEKSLDAADTVVFERVRVHGANNVDEHFYISCRRKGLNESSHNAASSNFPTYYMNSVHHSVHGNGMERTTATSTTRKLRLFGVNFECPEPDHLV